MVSTPLVNGSLYDNEEDDYDDDDNNECCDAVDVLPVSMHVAYR